MLQIKSHLVAQSHVPSLSKWTFNGNHLQEVQIVTDGSFYLGTNNQQCGADGKKSVNKNSNSHRKRRCFQKSGEYDGTKVISAVEIRHDTEFNTAASNDYFH